VQEGCLCFDLYEKSDEEGVFVLDQKWKDRLCLTRHVRSGKFRSLLIALDLLEGPPRLYVSYIPHELELDNIQELMSLFGGHQEAEWGLG
jgi:quinol monooxygenase YgiN